MKWFSWNQSWNDDTYFKYKIHQKTSKYFSFCVKLFQHQLDERCQMQCPFFKKTLLELKTSMSDHGTRLIFINYNKNRINRYRYEVVGKWILQRETTLHVSGRVLWRSQWAHSQEKPSLYSLKNFQCCSSLNTLKIQRRHGKRDPLSLMTKQIIKRQKGKKCQKHSAFSNVYVIAKFHRSVPGLLNI